MINGILGKKVGMTQIFDEKGQRIPVTVLEAGPVKVIQKKTKEKEGYCAIQVGFEEIKGNKLKRVTKPVLGHVKGMEPYKHLREFAYDAEDAVEVGKVLDCSLFGKGELVDVAGTSKGRGFAGVVKRHNFAGGPASHGHRFHRTTGSIGMSADPARVFKNTKMPGRMGNCRVTVKGLSIVDVRPELNAILVKGSVPGPNGRLVEIRRSNSMFAG